MSKRLAGLLKREDKSVQFVGQNNEGLKILFNIENHSTSIVRMINFGLFELLLKLNGDICESYKLDIQNENSARITLVLKHLLKDLGVPQMCAHMRLVKETRDDLIIITVTHSLSEAETSVDDYELVPIKRMVVYCDTTNPHNINVCVDVFYNDSLHKDGDETNDVLEDVVSVKPTSLNMQHFVERMIKTMVTNIINRLKQFIENLPCNSNIH